MALAMARRVGVVAGVSIKGAHCPTGGLAGATETGERLPGERRFMRLKRARAKRATKIVPEDNTWGSTARDRTPRWLLRPRARRGRRRIGENGGRGVRTRIFVSRALEGAETERCAERVQASQIAVLENVRSAQLGRGNAEGAPDCERDEYASAHPAPAISHPPMPAPPARSTCRRAAAPTRGSLCGSQIPRRQILSRVPCVTRATAAGGRCRSCQTCA